MKDRQVNPTGAEPRIFLISAVLHCVSMTGLVFLRSSFGFGFLRPKSVFFAFSWAFTLYTIYAWMQGGVWRDHRALLCFGIGATIFYWSHLLTVFIREWRESGEHEQYSGTPHPVWLILRTGNTPSAQFENIWRLWGEPSTVLAVGGVLQLISGEPGFIRWVLVLALCLWSKEFLNRWFHLRQRKRRSDMFADTEDVIEPQSATDLSSRPLLATRRAKVKRSRNADATSVEPREKG